MRFSGCSLFGRSHPVEPFSFTGTRGIYDGFLKQNRLLLLTFYIYTILPLYGRRFLCTFLISSTSVLFPFPLFPSGARRWRFFRKSGKQHKEKAALLPRAARERGQTSFQQCLCHCNITDSIYLWRPGLKMDEGSFPVSEDGLSPIFTWKTILAHYARHTPMVFSIKNVLSSMP